jgi:hypothetical protein
VVGKNGVVPRLLFRLFASLKATFPHKGRLTQSGVKQKFEAVKHHYKLQFIILALIWRWGREIE